MWICAINDKNWKWIEMWNCMLCWVCQKWRWSFFSYFFLKARSHVICEWNWQLNGAHCVGKCEDKMNRFSGKKEEIPRGIFPYKKVSLNLKVKIVKECFKYKFYLHTNGAALFIMEHFPHLNSRNGKNYLFEHFFRLCSNLDMTVGGDCLAFLKYQGVGAHK